MQSSFNQAKLDGYVALVSVMILVAIAGIFLSFGYLNIINFNDSSAVKRDAIQAQAAANSCAEIAIVLLQDDFNQTGGANYTIGSSTCTIVQYTGAGNTNRTVRTSSQVGLAEIEVEVVIDTIRPNVIISSWERV